LDPPHFWGFWAFCQKWGFLGSFFGGPFSGFAQNLKMTVLSFSFLGLGVLEYFSSNSRPSFNPKTKTKSGFSF
jgi:hypothetical protein